MSAAAVPVAHQAQVWPKEQEFYLRPVICTVYLLVLCILSVLFQKRVGTWAQLKRLPIMQLLVIMLLGMSLLFVLLSALILFGIGSSYSEASCNVGIWICLLLYAGTKAVLYVLLLEKLHVVHRHSSAGRVKRLQSWWYRVGLLLFVAWLGVAVTMIVGRIALIREHDGACIIGLRLYATIPMLSVDAITNIFLTSGFVYPIWKSNFPKAQRLARVSAIAAVAALITSFANIFVMTLQHGHQLSFVCLGSCGLDVAFNSAAVFFVTTAGRTRDEATTTQGSMVGDYSQGGSKGRSSRGASLFPGSAMNPFNNPFTIGAQPPGAPGAGTGVGVTVVEEVRVEEDLDDIPLPPTRRYSHRPPLHQQTTVSFADPRMDESSDDDSFKAPNRPDASAYLPRAL